MQNHKTERFLPVTAAQFDYGMSEAAFRRFAAAAGLKVYVLPGGVRLVERGALTEAVERLAEEIPAAAAV